MAETLRQYKAQLLRALAHPTRIAILEALRGGEVASGALLGQLQIEQANLSQHLAVLRARQVVVNRKVGNQVFYTVRDPVLIQVLDLLREYCQGQLRATLTTLGEIDGSPSRPA
jgi:ArsR family transcriptional regulator